MVSVRYETYQSEEHLHDLIELIGKDLSEPYSIFTYRYFLHNWPHLCHLVSIDNLLSLTYSEEGL